MSQYIGRRIVPVHGGVWDNSKNYEELTIVLHEASGDSYISRRPVPAGTVIDDKIYWMLYSLYSQQIADAVAQMEETDMALRKELSDTEGRMENRVTGAENLTNSNKAELNGRMDGIDKRLDANVAASTEKNADYAAEVVDARVDYYGKEWANLGSMNRGMVKNMLEHILSLDITDNGVVTAAKTDFMITKNLADGMIRKKYKLNGTLSKESLALISSKNYYLMMCDVEPNTTYTLFRQQNIAVESGYYNLKIATFTKSRTELLTLLERGNITIACDGDVVMGCTAAGGNCPERFVFTTGSFDKCVVIQLSEEIEPSYVEFIKGEHEERLFSSYAECVTNAFPVSGVTADGCRFFSPNKSLNLYTGQLDLDGYFISTASANVMQKSSGYFIAVIPVAGNTKYTVKISGTDMSLNSGEPYFKYATVKEIPNDPMDMVFSGLHKTVYSFNEATLTTSSEDSFLLVLPFSKEYRNANHAWLAVAEGDGEDMLEEFYADNQWMYSPDGIFVYAKNEVYNKSQTYRKSEVYSKEETDRVSHIEFEKNGNSIVITQGKATYHICRHTNIGINLDTWRIISGEINGEQVWGGTDIEGPVKQVGTDDFIGGCHGDEKYKKIIILLDGEPVAEDINTLKTFADNVTIFVTSDVYFCNDTEKVAFERQKKLEFNRHKLTVENTWRYVGNDPFSVERHTGCGLYSVYKDLLTGYSTNECCDLIKDKETSQSTTMDTVYFYGSGFVVTLHVLTGKGAFYVSRVADFASETRPRFKAYFDCVNHSVGEYVMKTEDAICASFEIEIV